MNPYEAPQECGTPTEFNKSFIIFIRHAIAYANYVCCNFLAILFAHAAFEGDHTIRHSLFAVVMWLTSVTQFVMTFDDL